MGYYATSQYRGDYYMGDYYHGDPGFFDDVLGVAKTVAQPLLAAASYLPGGIGAAAKAADAALKAGTIQKLGLPQELLHLGSFLRPAIGGAAPATPTMAATVPSLSLIAPVDQVGSPFGAPRSAGPGGRSTTFSLGGGKVLSYTHTTPMPGGSHPKHLASQMVVPMRRQGGGHRRMNALNPKALGRALRRAKGFEKYARKVLRLVAPHKHVDGFKTGAFGKRKRRA